MKQTARCARLGDAYWRRVYAEALEVETELGNAMWQKVRIGKPASKLIKLYKKAHRNTEAARKQLSHLAAT